MKRSLIPILIVVLLVAAQVAQPTLAASAAAGTRLCAEHCSDEGDQRPCYGNCFGDEVDNCFDWFQTVCVTPFPGALLPSKELFLRLLEVQAAAGNALTTVKPVRQ